MKVLSSLVALVMLTSTAMAADLDIRRPHRAAPLPPPQQYSQPTPQDEVPQYQPNMPFPQIQQPMPQFANAGICPRQFAVQPPCAFGGGFGFGGCGAQFAGGFGAVPWIGGPRFFGPRFGLHAGLGLRRF